MVNTGFYEWGVDFSLGVGAGRIKIFVSTPNLRNIVPFLYLLVATANGHTPCKFGSRKPKCWGPRWITKKSSARCAEIPQNWFFTYGTPTIRFSKSKFVWCVVVINSYQWVKKWNHISKIWRRYEDFKRQYPTKNPYPIDKIPCYTGDVHQCVRNVEGMSVSDSRSV